MCMLMCARMSSHPPSLLLCMHVHAYPMPLQVMDQIKQYTEHLNELDVAGRLKDEAKSRQSIQLILACWDDDSNVAQDG